MYRSPSTFLSRIWIATMCCDSLKRSAISPPSVCWKPTMSGLPRSLRAAFSQLFPSIRPSPVSRPDEKIRNGPVSGGCTGFAFRVVGSGARRRKRILASMGDRTRKPFLISLHALVLIVKRQRLVESEPSFSADINVLLQTDRPVLQVILERICFFVVNSEDSEHVSIHSHSFPAFRMLPMCPQLLHLVRVCIQFRVSDSSCLIPLEC